MLKEVINSQSTIRIEESFSQAKLRTVAGEIASQIALRNCSKEAWFSAQFYVLSEQRKLNMTGIHSFKISKKTDHQLHRQSVWPWLLGREPYHLRSTSANMPGREAFLSILKWTFFTSGPCTRFLNS